LEKTNTDFTGETESAEEKPKFSPIKIPEAISGVFREFFRCFPRAVPVFNRRGVGNGISSSNLHGPGSTENLQKTSIRLVFHNRTTAFPLQ
jgi:hypothetical protein